MATLLIKKRTLFERTEVFADGSACYEQDEEIHMPRPIKSIFLDKETYRDMDMPETLTISIEPGDKLNEPD